MQRSLILQKNLSRCARSSVVNALDRARLSVISDLRHSQIGSRARAHVGLFVTRTASHLYHAARLGTCSRAFAASIKYIASFATCAFSAPVDPADAILSAGRIRLGGFLPPLFASSAAPVPSRFAPSYPRKEVTATRSSWPQRTR